MVFLSQLEYSIQIWPLFGWYFPSKICMVPSLKLSIVIWLWYIALKLLWRIIFFILYQFLRRSTKNLPAYPDVRSLLFLCNKKWHKKFAPILIVCQRWRHSQKTQTGITFDLDVILTCGFFLKVIFFEGVSVEKIKLHAFSGVQYYFKNCSSGIWGWRFSSHFLKVLGFLRLIFLWTFFLFKKKTCMEKVYRYYEIPSSEDSYRVRVDTVSQNNLTKLQALCYWSSCYSNSF